MKDWDANVWNFWIDWKVNFELNKWHLCDKHLKSTLSMNFFSCSWLVKLTFFFWDINTRTTTFKVPANCILLIAIISLSKFFSTFYSCCKLTLFFLSTIKFRIDYNINIEKKRFKIINFIYEKIINIDNNSKNYKHRHIVSTNINITLA